MKTFLTLAFLFGLCSLPVLAGESGELGRLGPENRAVKGGVLLATHVQAVDAPAGEPLSEDYQLTVAGRKVPVYACRVSAVPFNQVWPGYQRPLDQTELAAFACWDMNGPVAVLPRAGRRARRRRGDDPEPAVQRPARRQCSGGASGYRPAREGGPLQRRCRCASRQIAPREKTHSQNRKPRDEELLCYHEMNVALRVAL